MENKVQKKINSGQIVTIDLETFYPKEPKKIIDLKDQLWKGFVLKEKDFRNFVKNNNWEIYSNCYVGICCTTEAIIPKWAYMLVAAKLTPYAKKVYFGNESQLHSQLMTEIINEIDYDVFKGKRVIVKGCGKVEIPENSYILITQKLQPIVRSIAYGEPCSSVPVFKSSINP